MLARLVCVYVLTLPCTIAWKLDSATGGEYRYMSIFGIFRLPFFYMGMLVGQASLHVELNERNSRRLAFACDGLAVVFTVLSLWDEIPGLPRTWRGPMLLQWFFDLPLVFLVFALCRGEGSILAYILSKSGINALAPYSYGIYLFHWPILQWVNFTLQGYGTIWSDIFKEDYSSMCFWPWGKKVMQTPPYIYISIYCVTIVFSVVFTSYAHEPFQKGWNRFLNSKWNAGSCMKMPSLSFRSSSSSSTDFSLDP